MNIKPLLHIILIAALFPVLTLCTGNTLTSEKNDTGHEYINSTGNLKLSKEKLEDAPAYEVYFILDKTVECMGISLETMNVPQKFKDESTPEKSFFVVEKLIDLNSVKGKIRKEYIQLGKNYNSRWEVHNPLKICGNTADPVSRLGGSVFRVRFTTFDAKPVYFTVTLYTPVNVSFSPDPAVFLQEKTPVK